MKKIKMIFFVLSILIFLLFIVVLFNQNNKKKINNNGITISNHVETYKNEFYESYYGKTNYIDYKYLLKYLCFNVDYENVPVTKNYKNKFKHSLSELYNFEKYNSLLYNYEISDSNQMLTRIEFDYLNENNFRVELLIQKEPFDNNTFLNRELYFTYFVDENGLLDDIKFIREEVYREDDGTPIIRTNFRKFDDNSEYFNYFEYLVLGLDLIKLNAEIDINAIGERNIENIEWKMKEYALTDNLKKHYDINQGIIPNELKSQAFKNKEIIVFSYVDNYYGNKDYKPFPKEKTMTVPIVLYYNYNEKSYYFNLSYSITDDNFLDSLELVEIQ